MIVISVLLKVIYASQWYSHSRVACALSRRRGVGSDSSASFFCQVLFAVFLDIIVHHVGTLSHFGASSSSSGAVVITFAYLIVVVST